MRKKIIGCVLLLVAGILVFGTLGNLGSLLKYLGTFFLVILGKASVDEGARAVGALFAQLLIFLAMYYSWKYGRKWTRKQEDPIESNKPDSADL